MRPTAPRGVMLRTGEVRIVEPVQHSTVPGWHLLAVIGAGCLSYLAIFALVALLADSIATAFLAVFITAVLSVAAVSVWIDAAWNRDEVQR